MNEGWWWAVGLIVAGLVLGTLASLAARRYIGADTRRPALREAAGPASALLFWLFVAAGLIAAVASTSPTTIEDIPSDLLGWLPRLGVAGIILIAGYVFATVAATAIARAASRATGKRQTGLETTIRTVIVGGAVVLALDQLGVDTTLLDVLVAVVAIGAVATLAGVAIVGGRHTAQSVAAGKAIAEHLTIGSRATLAGHTGALEGLTATHAVLRTERDETIVVSYRLIDDQAIVINPADPDTAT